MRENRAILDQLERHNSFHQVRVVRVRKVYNEGGKDSESFVGIVGVESNNLSRRSTGFVEFHHTVCLINCGESLRPLLTIVVGGLEADSDSECHDVKVLVVKNWGSFSPPLNDAQGSIIT